MNISNTYDRIPLSFKKGEGVFLYTKNNNKYLDLGSGVAVNALGYNHPLMNKAITNQIKKFIHVSNIFEIEEQTKLANFLCQKTGYDSTFFCNSGTEANEAALKFSRLFNKKKYFVSFQQGFHGRTFGSLSVTNKKSIQDPFKPLLNNCKNIEFNNIKDLEKVVSKDVSAIIFEYIQGEGGINIIDSKFIKKIFSLAKKYKIVTIADEVQTGIGRTGKFLAAEHFFNKADITTLAKGLGGGLPIGAVLINKNISKVITPGSHGSTFGGNPLVCHTSLEILKKISNQKFLDQINNVSNYLFLELKKLQNQFPKIIKEIRGKGLLCGIEFFDDELKKDLVKILRIKYKILVLTAGKNTIRIAPPLIIKKSEIKIFLQIFKEYLSKNS